MFRTKAIFLCRFYFSHGNRIFMSFIYIYIFFPHSSLKKENLCFRRQMMIAMIFFVDRKIHSSYRCWLAHYSVIDQTFLSLKMGKLTENTKQKEEWQFRIIFVIYRPIFSSSISFFLLKALFPLCLILCFVIKCTCGKR